MIFDLAHVCLYEFFYYSLNHLRQKLEKNQSKTEQTLNTLRKLMNVDHLHNLGWKHTIELETGIAMAYEDFLANRVRKM